MLLLIIGVSLIVLPILQIRAYNQRKAVKKYFLDNQVDYVLVCPSAEMKESLTQAIDYTTYSKIRIVAIEPLAAGDTREESEVLKAAVKRAGIMQLPCMLHFDGYEVTGKYYQHSSEPEVR
jgi:cellobiose-specific phosphotransferase system component IIB